MNKEIRIAVHNPIFLLQDQYKNFNGYNYVFTLKYADVLYITDYRNICEYKKKLKELNREDIRIVYTTTALNRMSDIVIGFSGRVDKLLHCCSAHYHGLKIYHVMDYVYCAHKANNKLKKRKVDYVLGYCNHGKHCGFFQKYYSGYKDKVIAVPFGFGERFKAYKPFNERINKAIALGSVNPINDAKDKSLKEYAAFFDSEEFTHKLRRAVVLHRDEWREYIDDKLPTHPETKNPFYDPVEELNNYTMFINDAGLMNFPPARTYEGIACGCVMVAEDREIYKDLGFVDSVNCILFEPGNYEQMVSKVEFYIKNPQLLINMHDNSVTLSKKYTHGSVASYLYREVMDKYEKWK